MNVTLFTEETGIATRSTTAVVDVKGKRAHVTVQYPPISSGDSLQK